MRKVLLSLAVLATFIGGSVWRPQAAQAAAFYDCSANAIMQCGAKDPQTFIAKLRAQKAHKDLQDIFANYPPSYTLKSDAYDDFAKNAVEGTIRATDGAITVNDQIVGYSIQNLSRTHSSEFSKTVMIKVNGKDKAFYDNAFTKTNHADEQPIMVWFDGYGMARRAILNSTGSPQIVRAVISNLKCDKLQADQVTDQPNTYDFTTNASATNGTMVVGVNYDFGDGTKVTSDDTGQPYRHRFTKNSTVTAYPRFKMVGSGKIITWTGASCTTQITYKKPAPKPTPAPAPTKPSTGTCAMNEPTLVDKNARSYQFTVRTTASNAKLTSADVNFGDGVATKGIAPNNGTQIAINHSFAKAGTYTVTTTAYFTNAVVATCTKQLQVTDPQVQAATTTSATDTSASDDVANATADDTATADSTSLAADNTSSTDNTGGNDSLINTGPGNVAIGMFVVFSAAAGVAHYYFRRRLGA